MISLRSAEEAAAQMEELRRKHETLVEEERAAEQEKEERRKARAKAERERRDQERAHAESSSTPSSSSTPAPWPQGMPITGALDAAAHARREADKGASLEQAAEHSARLRQREKVHIQEAMRKMGAIRLAEMILRGD
jgi:hypothetical protein